MIQFTDGYYFKTTKLFNNRCMIISSLLNIYVELGDL